MKDRAADTGADERAPAGDRWVARADQGSPEARAGALLRQAVRREPLEAGRLAAIRRRLGDGRRRPQRHWALRLAIASALVLSGGALTAASQRYLGWLAPAPPAPTTPAAEPLPQARRARAATSPLAPVPTAPAETAPPDPTPSPRAPAEGARPSVPAPPPAAPAAVTPAATTPPPAATSEPALVSPPASSALAQESAMLGEALRKLRQGDDPRGALALLDEHDVLFPGGVLAPEAMLARIEALVRMHRNRDALSLLDQTAPSARGSGRELLIARAELRAAAGRCAAAAADFDPLLRRDPPADPITERALWGRAACRATAGDGAGARSDLEDYLALFPEGRFAREARRALEP